MRDELTEDGEADVRVVEPTRRGQDPLGPRQVAQELLVETTLRSAPPADAVPAAEMLTRREPLREEGWRLLALGQYTLGRQGDALATLRKAFELMERA